MALAGALDVVGLRLLPGRHLLDLRLALGVELALGLAQAGAAGVAVGELRRQLAASFVAEALVLGSVSGFGLFEDLRSELAVGAVVAIGGVSGHPGAVEGDRPDRWTRSQGLPRAAGFNRER
ncbi:MAG: hypothetical protein EXQ70_01270 [Solirubrobacterales bacterium]|nr:hypothetical protein [Solirubrobacterales bacterium]